MGNLSIFKFEENEIRTVFIDGEIWFVAKDIAKVLGYADTSKAIEQHCKYAKSLNLFKVGETTTFNEINNLHPQTKLIPESDVFRLIIKSKLPSAEKFERLVMEEILPSIRKHGGYNIKPLSQEEILVLYANQLLEHKLRMDNIENKQLKSDEKINKIENEAKRLRSHSDYYSIVGFANKVKYKIDIKKASMLGRKCAIFCKSNNISTDTTDNPRFGTVKVYPLDVLVKIFKDFDVAYL